MSIREIPTKAVTRLPIVTWDEYQVALSVGEAVYEFGDWAGVSVDLPYGEVISGYVAGVDTLAVSEISEDVANLFSFKNAEELLQGLSRVYKTALPSDLPVTIYTLSKVPVETFADPEEAMTSDEVPATDEEDTETA